MQNILKRVSELVAQRRDKLAALCTEETGKTIRDARWEMDRAVNVFTASAEEARKGMSRLS